MSKIEEAIQTEKAAVARRAAAKSAAASKRSAVKWSEWVEAEKPRIANFRKKFNRFFPCLKGDYVVNPRPTPGYLQGRFIVIVDVCDTKLEIRETANGQNHLLFIPKYERGDPYTQYELAGDADLKDKIKKFIEEREAAERYARDHYNDGPIGNTD